MTRDDEGYEYCDKCGEYLGYAYPSRWCNECRPSALSAARAGEVQGVTVRPTGEDTWLAECTEHGVVGTSVGAKGACNIGALHESTVHGLTKV